MFLGYFCQAHLKHAQLMTTVDFRFDYIIVFDGAMFDFADVTENSVFEHSIHQDKTGGNTNRVICTIKPVLRGDQRRNFKSHFLRISRIERHSRKIEFFIFILPKYPFG